MGSTLDFIGGTLADALSPQFRRPVEDIIYETIDRKQIPTRTDFSELRNTINSLRSQSTGAQKGIEKLKNGLDDIEESIHDLTTRMSDLEQEIQKLRSENSSLQGSTSSHTVSVQSTTSEQDVQLNSILERLSLLENTPTVTNATSMTESTSCRVEGCTKTIRAGGFCSSHYSKWRRGTLSGFVSYEGFVTVNDEEKVVSTSFKGLAYSVQDGTVFINEREVDAS